MAVPMEIEFDQVAIQRAIDGIQATGKAIGLTVQWMVWDTSRLAANDAIKYTAPWAGGQKPGNGKAQKDAGEKAIGRELLGKGDFRGLFGAIDEMPYHADKGNWSRQAPGYALLRNKAGAVWLVDQDHFRPNAGEAELREFHLAHRTKGGHVVRSQNRGSWSRTIGRWKASDKMYARKAAVNNYVKSVQSRVGSLKASWLPAANYFAGLTGGKVSAPAWVTRHAGEGAFINAIQQSGDGFAGLISKAHHSAGIRQDMIPFIVKRRDADLNKWLPKRMEKVAARFEAGQAKAEAVTA